LEAEEVTDFGYVVLQIVSKRAASLF